MLFNESGCWAMFPLCWHLISHRSTVLPFPSLTRLVHLKQWAPNVRFTTEQREEWMPSNSRFDPSSPVRWPVPLDTSSRSCKEITGHPTFMSCQSRITVRIAGAELYLLHVLHLKYFHGTRYVVIRAIIWMPAHFPNHRINSKMLYKHALCSTRGWQANSSHNNWPVVSWVANVCQREATKKRCVRKP